MAQKNTSAIPKATKHANARVVRYNKWGYIFLIPFFATFLVFTLYPLVSTVYYSFTDYKKTIFGTMNDPKVVGLENYKYIFQDGRIWKYAGNTMIMWVMGFIPQILVSLLLAQWFSDTRLGLKGSTFFKTVIYMPNLIMAAAFAMLFFALFSTKGPINAMLMKFGWIEKEIEFLQYKWATRSLVAAMNFLMWFGNTTILLMAGIMGIDGSLYEAAEIDGANSWQRFTKITLPLLKPILVYVMITSLIGGIQMFDVPKILTKDGHPADSATTLIMWLNNFVESKHYGRGGALSVVLFVFTGVLSLVVYFVMYRKKGKGAS